MTSTSAYWDESNNPAASAVAGVILDTNSAPDFDAAWRKALDAECVRNMHMKDFAQFTGEFRCGWKDNPDRRKRFLESLIDVMSRHTLFAISTVIPLTDFDSFVVTPERVRLFGSAYETAALHCIVVAAKWADESGREGRVIHVFDRGNPKRHDFEKSYDNLADSEKHRNWYRLQHPRAGLKGLSFADDEDVCALQAADFLAYESAKLAMDAITKRIAGPEQMRASLRNAMGSINGKWQVMTKDVLEDLERQYYLNAALRDYLL